MISIQHFGSVPRRIALAAMALGVYCVGTFTLYAQEIPRDQAAAQAHLPTNAAPNAPVAMKKVAPVVGQPLPPQGSKAFVADTPAAKAANLSTTTWGLPPNQAPASAVKSPVPAGIQAQLKVPAQIQPHAAAPPYFTEKSLAPQSGRPAEGLVGLKEFCDIKANYLDANSIPYEGHLLPCTCRGKGSRSSPKGCNAFTLENVSF